MSIRHNCEHGGCYIKEHTPNWAMLDDAFSGRIAVGDIDGIVEANGRLLILEWKGTDVDTIPKGQEIMFKNATKLSPHVMVFVINGNTNPLFVHRIRVFKGGVMISDEQSDNNTLFKMCQAWEQKAREGTI